jgi:hypothetical protein
MKTVVWKNGLPKKSGMFWVQWQCDESKPKWSIKDLIMCNLDKDGKPHFQLVYNYPVLQNYWQKGTFRHAGPIPLPVERKDNLK